MQTLLPVLLTLMVVFWMLALPSLYSCTDRDGWFARVMENQTTGTVFLAVLVAIGFGIGAIGLYSNAVVAVMGYGGGLWESGHRLSCLAVTTAFFVSFVVASFTAIGISGFFVVEVVKDIISACTGTPRVQTAG
jgi:hypothetical protein